MKLKDALLREDMEEFALWNHVGEDEHVMSIPDSRIAAPMHDVSSIHVPQKLKDFDERKSILVETPAWKARALSFGEIFTQSFRDRAAEGCIQPRLCPATGFGCHARKVQTLLDISWPATGQPRLDSCMATAAASSTGGYRRNFKGCAP